MDPAGLIPFFSVRKDGRKNVINDKFLKQRVDAVKENGMMNAYEWVFKLGSHSKSKSLNFEVIQSQNLPPKEKQTKHNRKRRGKNNEGKEEKVVTLSSFRNFGAQFNLNSESEGCQQLNRGCKNIQIGFLDAFG